MEAKWRFEKDLKETNYYASSYFSWYNYSTGIVSDILENLQLQIKDVHIRYEDTCSIPSQCVAFGITIESLLAQSCDANWTSGFVQSNENHSFKLLELNELAIHWMTFAKEESYANLSVAEIVVSLYIAFQIFFFIFLKLLGIDGNTESKEDNKKLHFTFSKCCRSLEKKQKFATAKI